MRFVIFQKNIFLVSLLLQFAASQRNLTTNVPGTCICAPEEKCVFASGGPPDGQGILNPRIMTSGGSPAVITGSLNSSVQPVTTGINLAVTSQTSCAAQLERCCPQEGHSCGLRFPSVSSVPSPPPGTGQASYGAYPFSAVMYSMNGSFLGAGVLIDQFHVLTAAHKIYNTTSPIAVRFGEYDLSSQNEPLPVITINATFVIHENFNDFNLKNDIALLTLAAPVPLGKFPTISNICLPNRTISNIRCFVAGWGRNNYENEGPLGIMKEIDVPLLDGPMCESMLQKTEELGPDFKLDQSSFICAGGEAGKDACTGDGGSALSCYIYDRFYLFGLVAWGVKCGQENVPGVYVNIQTYIPWIQQKIRAEQTQTTTRAVETGTASTSTTRPSTTATTPATTTTTRITTTSSPLIRTTTQTPASPPTTTVTTTSSRQQSSSTSPLIRSSSATTRRTTLGVRKAVVQNRRLE